MNSYTELRTAVDGALHAIADSLGEGVSFTCHEYAAIRELAELVGFDVDRLDARHASTDDQEGDCMHAAYLVGIVDGF